jgi:hypothetical protein
MRQVRILFVLAAAAMVAACAPDGSHEDDDGTHPGHDGGGDGFIDGGGFVDGGGGNHGDGGGQQNGACDKMDILFVVDNSGSMEEEQQNLAANFPMFVNIIENYVTSAGSHLDYHIAVTTTDRTFTEQQPPIFPGFPSIPFPHMGNDGKFQTGSNCQFPGGRKFLQRGDSNVGATFSCAAKVGTGGDSSEMPLETAKLALVDRVQDGYNAGFLRPDALLAIVMLTDENDCSISGDNVMVTGLDLCQQANPVPPYLTTFDNVKGGERGRWAAAVIAGPGPGVCESAFGSADEATRLKQFTTAVGTNAVFSSICEGNLAQSLMDAFETFGVACENIPID